MNGILYYPYINVPKTDWTLRSLFYYDTVASIVPQQFIWEPERHYDPYMWKLVQEGLVVPINPMAELRKPWEIGKPFLDFVKSEEFKIELRRANFRRGQRERLHEDKFNGSKIHADKFADSIYYSLTDLGLAKRENGSWYNVERKTAAYLMEYLATILSQKLDRRAVTDKRPITPFGNKALHSINRRRYVILEKLIPFPREVNYGKLLDFKMQHQGLLIAFRNRIEALVLDTNIEQGSELFNNRLEELIIRKEELTAQMNKSQLKDIILGSVCGAVGASLTLVTAGSMWGAAASIPSFINAIHSALKIEKPENIFDQSGLKYLALLDKRLG